MATGVLKTAKFDQNLAAAVDGAHLGAHHAVLFTPDSGKPGRRHVSGRGPEWRRRVSGGRGPGRSARDGREHRQHRRRRFHLIIAPSSAERQYRRWRCASRAPTSSDICSRSLRRRTWRRCASRTHRNRWGRSPDMRAKPARRRVFQRAHNERDLGHQRGGRRLKIVCACRTGALRDPTSFPARRQAAWRQCRCARRGRAKMSAVARGRRGLMRMSLSEGSAGAGRTTSPSPAHPEGARYQTRRHVGPERGRDRQKLGLIAIELPEKVERAQRRRGVGRTAAYAGGNRQILFEMNARASSRVQRPRGAQAPNCRHRAEPHRRRGHRSQTDKRSAGAHSMRSPASVNTTRLSSA